MPSRRLDRFVALACLVLLLLTKGAAIAGAPTPNSDQPSAVPSPSVVATPAPRPNPEILTAAPEVPAAIATPAPNSDQPIAAPSAAVVATPVSPTQETTAQPEVPAAAAIDAPIIEQLHNLANGKFDRIIGSTKERTSIDAFYAGRNYAPLWLTDGKANARAQAAIAYLGQVSADGLDPSDYPVPDFASLTDPVALADAEWV